MPVDKTTISGVSGDKYDKTYTIQTITILIDGRNNLPSIFYIIQGSVDLFISTYNNYFLRFPKLKQVSEYRKKAVEILECLDGDPMKIAVILTAYYGLRRSEVLGLKWDAIDPVEDKIYIRHKIIENKLNGNEIEGLDVMKTKSSYRSLPLMPFIKKALEEERARQEEMQRVLRKSYNRKYLDYVCVDAMGDILKPQYVTEHFKVILERNGLKKIRFHDLRHSCASLMLANDISMKEIQEWLGHSNISTTANIYAHVDSESKRESARIIDKVLSTEEAV